MTHLHFTECSDVEQQMYYQMLGSCVSAYLSVWPKFEWIYLVNLFHFYFNSELRIDKLI
jgi:hypothetical protein